MKYKFTKSALLMTTLIGTILLTQPEEAFADKAITVQPINIFQEGNPKSIPMGVTLDLLGNDGKKAKILWENQTIELESRQVLKTTKTTHLAWMLEKGAVVTVESSLFPIERFITEEQTVTIVESSEERLDDTVLIRLEDLTVGIVHKMYVKELTKETNVKTPGFAYEPYEINGISIEVGDPLIVTSYKNEQYLVEVAGKEVALPVSFISWEKPLAKMAEIQAEKERVAKEQQRLEKEKQRLERTNTLIAQAKSKLGLPYVWGGNGPNGYDCSGYTKVLYSMIGIELPRTAAEQALIGTRVDLDSLQVGDMVFYETYKKGPSHVSIYMGEGKVIHAAGKQVQISGLHAPYWNERILFAKRVL